MRTLQRPARGPSGIDTPAHRAGRTAPFTAQNRPLAPPGGPRGARRGRRGLGTGRRTPRSGALVGGACFLTCAAQTHGLPHYALTPKRARHRPRINTEVSFVE